MRVDNHLLLVMSATLLVSLMPITMFLDMVDMLSMNNIIMMVVMSLFFAMGCFYIVFITILFIEKPDNYDTIKFKFKWAKITSFTIIILLLLTPMTYMFILGDDMGTIISNNFLVYFIILYLIGVVTAGVIVEYKIIRPLKSLMITDSTYHQVEIDPTINLIGSIYMKMKNLETIQIFSMIVIVVNTFVWRFVSLPETNYFEILTIIKLTILFIGAAIFTTTSCALIN